MNRSGTNFLADALGCHRDVRRPAIGEDYLLEHAGRLTSYARDTAHRWGDHALAVEGRFLRGLGRELITALDEAGRDEPPPAGSRLVTKTPRAHGLDALHALLPTAKLILLVRDGRDVTESAARSFPYAGRRYWAGQWREGARLIAEFSASRVAARDRDWTLVRYEDLLAGGADALLDLVRFCDLDPAGFDRAAFDALPLRGSSSHRGGRTEVHWKPVEKPKDFKPVGRWQSWPWWWKAWFAQYAGAEMRGLGYEC
ncbi:sulfotransferase family protein [Alienimonas californiensis]